MQWESYGYVVISLILYTRPVVIDYIAGLVIAEIMSLTELMITYN